MYILSTCFILSFPNWCAKTPGLIKLNLLPALHLHHEICAWQIIHRPPDWYTLNADSWACMDPTPFLPHSAQCLNSQLLLQLQASKISDTSTLVPHCRGSSFLSHWETMNHENGISANYHWNGAGPCIVLALHVLSLPSVCRETLAEE